MWLVFTVLSPLFVLPCLTSTSHLKDYWISVRLFSGVCVFCLCIAAVVTWELADLINNPADWTERAPQSSQPPFSLLYPYCLLFPSSPSLFFFCSCFLFLSPPLHPVFILSLPLFPIFLCTFLAVSLSVCPLSLSQSVSRSLSLQTSASDRAAAPQPINSAIP